ncbi:MAG TPA: hypothetical protein PLL09_02980 [Flavobacterium sp.]|uniref:hypothetical protein n=1 Tax=unclassified Flavobacterium TaxID=196869 RepID=UPI0025BD103D|nr:MULTISPECIES: hypothetical protein [unclassified Flavobacterium]HRE76769.1 hypothetical protein [Flavobacterium sp.]
MSKQKEHAWEPILNVFRLVYGNETDADSANFLFSKSICALRLYFKSPKVDKQLKEGQESVNSSKDVVCYSLKFAQKNGGFFFR